MKNYEYLIGMEKKAEEALKKDGFNKLEVQSMIATPFRESPAQIQIISYDSQNREVTYRFGLNSTAKFSLGEAQ